MRSGESILVVHNNQLKASRISGALEVSGYQVVASYSAGEGVRLLYEAHPDLVIIEKEELLGEPGLPYLTIREEVYVPLIALGPRGDPAEVLEMGVDSYMREPVSLRELVARVRAILRRKHYYRGHRDNHGSSADHLDTMLQGARGTLTNTEFRLLSCLAMNAERVLPYPRLLSDVWGRTISRDSLHQCVRRVKRKLGMDSAGRYRLLNYPGEGYCFSAAGTD